MRPLSILLSILLFVVGLSITITLHELGHYLTAKIFNVYTYEFSIGFGRKIVRYRAPGKETYFEIGILPFGGYVSLYGEDDDDKAEKIKAIKENPDLINEMDSLNPVEKEMLEKDIPLSRSLEGIAKWKKLIIMSAGVTMNFILGYVIFFIQSVAFPYNVYFPVVGVSDTSVQTELSTQLENLYDELGDESKFYTFQSRYAFDKNYEENKVVGAALSVNVKINNSSDTYALFAPNDLKITDISLDSTFTSSITSGTGEKVYRYYLYRTWVEERTIEFDGKTITGSFYFYDKDKNYYIESNYEDIEQVELTLTLIRGTLIYDEDNHPIDASIDKTEDDGYYSREITGTLTAGENGKLSSTNLNAVTDFSRYLGYKAFAAAGSEWVDSTSAIFTTLGGLFIGQGYENVGGIVMMFAQSTVVLEVLPFSYYLKLWGIISVNLGIINLLPFPGLDGWHLFVTLFEMIFRRRIPKKVKGIVQKVSYVLLFGLMATLIIADIIKLATTGVMI